MPTPQEFKKKLGLEPGAELAEGYVIQDVEVSLKSKSPHELYNLPVELTIQVPSSSSPLGGEGKGTGTKKTSRSSSHAKRLESVLSELVKDDQQVGGNKILYSAYGTPYEVNLEDIKSKEDQDQGLVHIHCLGVARRRRDIPTMAQQEKAGMDKEQEKDLESSLKGMRCTTAHFNSSSGCKVCGEKLMPGQRIAKPEHDKGRGGWSHVTCLAEGKEEEEPAS